jgi:general secretion pathway protein G
MVMDMNQQFINCRKGFTLIELLVVLAIITSLMMLAVPKYFASIDYAKEVTLQQNIKIIRETIDKYYGDTGEYPESLQQLVDKRYLKSLPVDPITEKTDSWIITSPPSDPTNKIKGKVYDIKSGAVGKTLSGVSYDSF